MTALMMNLLSWMAWKAVVVLQSLMPAPALVLANQAVVHRRARPRVCRRFMMF